MQQPSLGGVCACLCACSAMLPQRFNEGGCLLLSSPLRHTGSAIVRVWVWMRSVPRWAQLEERRQWNKWTGDWRTDRSSDWIHYSWCVCVCVRVSCYITRCGMKLQMKCVVHFHGEDGQSLRGDLMDCVFLFHLHLVTEFPKQDEVVWMLSSVFCIPPCMNN